MGLKEKEWAFLNDRSEYYTIPEVAVELGVTEAKVRELIKGYKLPYVNIEDEYRIPRDRFFMFLEPGNLD